ncbi:hypothetical protein BH23GEM6_BH23GEM6_23570 [soil metagenome]
MPPERVVGAPVHPRLDSHRMADAVLSPVLFLLAFAGGAALVYRSVGGLFRLALRASQETAAAQLAEVSARRGDLTEMAERRRAAEAARRDRRRVTVVTLFWMLWLAVPLILGWAPTAFAVAALLWLLPPPTRSRGAPRA